MNEGITLAQVCMKHMQRNHARRNWNGLKKWEKEIEVQAIETLIEATADFAFELYRRPGAKQCFNTFADECFSRAYQEFLGEWVDIGVRGETKQKALLRFSSNLHHSVSQTGLLLERHGYEL